MSRVRSRLVALIFAGFCVSSSAASELRHNPFRAPVDVTGSSSSGSGRPASNARPTLIGILLGDDQPLVNLDGTIIGVGEEAAGYLLVEVGPEHAVFRRGEETITMSLYPSENDE